MVITPSLSLMHCPICNEKLHLESMFSEKNTVCSNCGYQEPAGSAHFVTFTSEVLARFLTNLKVNKVSIGGVRTDNLLAVLDSQSILPAILINAKLNTKNISHELSSIPLTTVEDKGGYYHRRVVTTTSQIKNPALIISTLAETLFATHLLSMESTLNKKEGILDLNLISPVSVVKNKNIEQFASDESVMAGAFINQEM